MYIFETADPWLVNYYWQYLVFPIRVSSFVHFYNIVPQKNVYIIFIILENAQKTFNKSHLCPCPNVAHTKSCKQIKRISALVKFDEHFNKNKANISAMELHQQTQWQRHSWIGSWKCDWTMNVNVQGKT